MSKYNRKYFLGLILMASAIFFMGCPTPPEFPAEPTITFRDVTFEQRTNPSQPNVTEDVITVTIGFEDGNGDLGLSSEDINPPYNQFFIPIDDNRLPFYIGQNDTLPPYSPLDYLTLQDEGDTLFVGNAIVTIKDTIYIERNPRFFNIFIKTFYQPNPNSDFVEYDWEAPPTYQSFNGRFPILNTEDYERPLNGELSYELKSSGFRSIFRENPVIIEVFIMDREGNKSNTVRSDSFKLLLE